MVFIYKLIPPRPTFAADQTADEAAVMARHIAYWTGHYDNGLVAAFGPVAEPSGAWGMALVETDSAADVQQLGRNDPAVTPGLATFEVIPMPMALIRPARADHP